MNMPTSSGHNKEEHMLIAHRLGTFWIIWKFLNPRIRAGNYSLTAAMEKRRVGTRFLDHEVTEADLQKPLVEVIQGKVF